MSSQLYRIPKKRNIKETPDTVSRLFTSAFVLDKTKLTRLLNIIEDRYKAENLEFRPSFKVIHRDQKKINLAAVDDLFALDNTTRNPIIELEVEAKQEPLHSSFGFRSSARNNIALVVQVTGRPKLANQIFAEVEEQIERTFSRDLVNKYLKGGSFGISSIIDGLVPIVFISFVVLIVGVFLFSTGDSKSKLRELYQKAEQSKDVNSKIEFIYAQQAHEFSKDDINFSSIKLSGFLMLVYEECRSQLDRDVPLVVPTLLVKQGSFADRSDQELFFCYGKRAAELISFLENCS